MALTDFLTSVADAIRTKDGTTEPIVATDFPSRILAIPSGGSSDLPSNIKTGTFTVAEDTAETITIPHGIGAEPTMYLIFPDNPEYAIGNISYAILGFAKFFTYAYVSDYQGKFTYKANLTNVTVDDTNIVITVSSDTYKLRAGLKYRWFAWG